MNGQQEMNKAPNETRLWAALVDHQYVPGTRAVLFAQVDTPADDDVLSRFNGECDAGDLQVVGMFDLTHVIATDARSGSALRTYVFGGARPFTRDSAVDDMREVPLDTLNWLLDEARELKDMKTESNDEYSPDDLASWDDKLDAVARLTAAPERMLERAAARHHRPLVDSAVCRR